MAYVLYGVGGVLLALALLAAGAAAGWKARGAWIDHTKRAVAEEVSEEEKRREKAEQQAFSGMLNYSAEVAYGGRMLGEEGDLR